MYGLAILLEKKARLGGGGKKRVEEFRLLIPLPRVPPDTGLFLCLWFPSV